MFFETRVLDAEGNLKYAVSPEKLSRHHWEKFDEQEERSFAPKSSDLIKLAQIKDISF